MGSDQDLKVIFQPGPIGISYKGNRITEVFPLSQAAKAGVYAGWRIISINGNDQPDETNVVVQSMLEAQKGKKIEVVFLSLQKHTITFQPEPFGIKYEGRIITDIVPNTQGSKAGIDVGWYIISVNGEEQPHKTDAILQAINQTKLAGKPTKITFLPSQ